MSEPQEVKITGGTMFIGLLVFLILLAVWDIRRDIQVILKRLPAPQAEQAKR